MDADFCVTTLEEAIARHASPDIFNTDQGSQFTSFAFTTALKDADIASRSTGAGAGWTTSSSSGCGAASKNTNASFSTSIETGSEARKHRFLNRLA
jgi:putative transposase